MNIQRKQENVSVHALFWNPKYVTLCAEKQLETRHITDR